MTGYPSEVEMLLCCTAPQGIDRHARRIGELLDGTLDWPVLMALAASQGVTPLLYWALKAVREEIVPAELARHFQDNTLNSVHLTAELLRLLDLLSAAKIPVLPFKGPTLAISAYGNLALRQFVDIDLLVPQEEALRARGLLIENGYHTRLELSSGREEQYLRAYDEFVLSGNGSPLLVELHWRATRPYYSIPLDIGEFFSRAARVRLGQREVPSLCNEDMLMLLCVHGTKHCWSHLSLVADLAWLVNAHEVRWTDVLGRVQALGALRMTLLGVALVNRLFDIPIPVEIQEPLAADPTIQPLTSGIISTMLSHANSGGGILKTALFHMRTRERWQDRMRYLFRLSLTQGVEDWQCVDLPPSLSFLYYFLRFPRLLRKYRQRIP